MLKNTKKLNKATQLVPIVLCLPAWVPPLWGFLRGEDM